MDAATFIQGGYVLLPRVIFDHEIASAPLHFRWIWVYLFANASHGDAKHLRRGQILTTLDALASICSYRIGYRSAEFSRKSAWRACEWLRERKMITTAKTTRGLLITICNYDRYQNPANYERNSGGDTESDNGGTAKVTKGEHDRQECIKNDKNPQEPSLDEPVLPKPQRQPRKPPARNLFSDAFEAAFNATFPEHYQRQDGDFVQLARWRREYPNVTAEHFAEVGRNLWAGPAQYRPGWCLTIRGLCANWAQAAARSAPGPARQVNHVTEVLKRLDARKAAEAGDGKA